MTYTQAAVGDSHAVLLRSDGTAVGFGSNAGLQQINIPDLPPGVTYTQVAAGVVHTVLLRSDGTAVAFGSNFAELDIPALPPGLAYTQVFAGGAATALMRSDGALIGNLPAPPTGVAYTYAGLGDLHSILLTGIPGSAPVANDDTVDAVEDTSITISTISLLENDVDPEGFMLSVVSVWGAQHGTTAININGNITYTPNANYFGTDTFQYLASDGSLGDAATVTITITGVEDAPVIDDVLSTPGIGNTWTVVVDTTDPDGDDVTVTVAAVDTAHVTVTGTAPWRIRITSPSPMPRGPEPIPERRSR